MTEHAPGRYHEGDMADRPCPGCGHDVARVPARDLGAALRDAGRDWQLFLSTVCDHPGGYEGLRTRPGPARWSAVEYGCHVRDVLSLFGRRVELAVLTDHPDLGAWDQDQTAVDDFYREQDPIAVADDIERAAIELARITQILQPGQFDRCARLGGTDVTVASLTRWALHEARHHLLDARAVVPDAA